MSPVRPLRHRPRSSPPAALAALAAVAFVTAACGSPPPSGVNTRSLATDLVYGIPPTPAPAPPANTAAEPENPLGTEIFLGPSSTTPPGTPQRPQDPCPRAPLTDAPPPSTPEVRGEPEEGTYRWVVEGTRRLPGGREVPLFPFAEREITNVSSIQNGFEFTTVEEDFGSNDVVYTTYQVRDPRATSDNAGVYIASIQRVSPQRDTTFNPSPAVLVLPLPADIDGSTFQSVGVDPVSLEALTHTGQVVARKRVDACGKFVDGWLVDAAQTFVRADGGEERRNYDYALATQFGAMPMFENVQTPCAPDEENQCPDDLNLDFEAHLGQESPDR